MKFSTSGVSILAALTVVSAIKSSSVARKKLLQAARRVEGDEDDAAAFLNFEDYPMAFEVRFQSCLALPAYSEDSTALFEASETMVEMANSGVIGAQESFVLFDICKSDVFGNPFDGNGMAESSSTSTSSCENSTYIIDLASWVDIATNQDLEDYNDGMTYDEAYCEACSASADFCQ
jgi:hypothetical protein